MGDGRVTQKSGNICYTQALFVQQVFGVFHSLLLIKIKYSGAKNFLESFLQIAFVHRNFTAEFLDGNWITNMMQKNISCLVNSFLTTVISQKLTGKSLLIFVY